MRAGVREWLAMAITRLLESDTVARPLEVLDRMSDNRISVRGMIAQAFEYKTINRVQGDYFEFGLWRGRTFRYAHRMKRRYSQHDVHLLGFDSFQGLPDTDDQKDNLWHKGQFQCSERELKQLLKRNGVRPDEYELFGGFYKDSLNEALHQHLIGKKAAIVYIDCDLYSSTIQVLEFIYRYLDNGTVVCFDDFYCYKAAPDQGEQKALTEFLCKHNDIKCIPYICYGAVGQSFIVRHDSLPNEPTARSAWHEYEGLKSRI